MACVLFTWIPASHGYLVNEDNVIENLSVVAYLLAALMALAYLVRRKAHKKLCVVLILLGLLGVLEELSYGERIFAFTSPVIGDVSIDGVHDIVFLGSEISKSRLGLHGINIWLAIGAISALVFVLLLCRSSSRQSIKAIFAQPSHLMLLFFGILGFTVLGIDMGAAYGLPLVLEEVLEMNAAVALVFCGLSLPRGDEAPASRDTNTSALHRGARPAAACLLIALTALCGAYYASLPKAERVRLSAVGGNSNAFYDYAYVLYHGEGFPMDREESLIWALQAAEAEDPRAQMLVAWQYGYGQGTATNKEVAASWCLKAAKQGEHWGEYNYGLMLYGGTGVEKDYRRAFVWMRRAAEGGLPSAEYLLGQMCEKGEGLERNRAKAAKWYRRAGEQGHLASQLRLGVLYLKGHGVEKDLVEAEHWLSKAAAQGNSKAKALLAAKPQRTEVSLSE